MSSPPFPHAVVIVVPPDVQSRRRPLYLEPLDDRPALAWLIAWLQRGFPRDEFRQVVLTCGVLPCAASRRIADEQGVAWFHSRNTGLLHALKEAAEALAIDTLITFPATSLFPDLERSRALFERHRASGSEASFADALPAGLTPEIYEARVLNRLAAFRLPPQSGSDPRKLIQCANAAVSPSEPPPFRRGDLAEGASPEALAALPFVARLTDRVSLAAAHETAIRLRDDIARAPQGAALYKRTYLRLQERETAGLPDLRPKREGVRRVLVCSAADVYTGSEDGCRLLIANLDRDRYEPLAVLEPGSELAERVAAAHVPVYGLDHDPTHLTPFALRAWEQMLTRFDVDLLHVDSFAMPAAVLAARRRGIPVVQHLRYFVKERLPDAFRFADAIVTVSEAVRLDLLRYDVSPERVLTIHNGVDPGTWRPGARTRDEARARYGLAEGAFAIVMVARISPAKRQDLAISALCTLLASVPEATLVFVGETYPDEAAYMQEVLHTVRTRGLESQVVFHGFETDMRWSYLAADVVLLCSDREPFPRTLLEAMTMGSPVVAPRCGGVAEMVRDGISGVLYPPGDAAALASCLRDLHASADVRRQLGEHARAAAGQFTIAASVRKVEALYERVLSVAAVPLLVG